MITILSMLSTATKSIINIIRLSYSFYDSLSINVFNCKQENRNIIKSTHSFYSVYVISCNQEYNKQIKPTHSFYDSFSVNKNIYIKLTPSFCYSYYVSYYAYVISIANKSIESIINLSQYFSDIFSVNIISSDQENYKQYKAYLVILWHLFCQ